MASDRKSYIPGRTFTGGGRFTLGVFIFHTTTAMMQANTTRPIAAQGGTRNPAAGAFLRCLFVLNS